jgi:hypothetical protein
MKTAYGNFIQADMQPREVWRPGFFPRGLGVGGLFARVLGVEMPGMAI